MKCLSMIQPHALLTVCGEKRTDLRSGQYSHRGPLLIHASKSWNRALVAYMNESPVRETVERHVNLETEGLRFGMILGQVDLIDCVLTKKMQNFAWEAAGIDREQERVFNHPEDGLYPWCLIFANPVRFSAPVPFRGHPRVFTVPDDVIPIQTRVELGVAWFRKHGLEK